MSLKNDHDLPTIHRFLYVQAVLLGRPRRRRLLRLVVWPKDRRRPGHVGGFPWGKPWKSRENDGKTPTGLPMKCGENPWLFCKNDTQVFTIVHHPKREFNQMETDKIWGETSKSQLANQLVQDIVENHGKYACLYMSISRFMVIYEQQFVWMVKRWNTRKLYKMQNLWFNQQIQRLQRPCRDLSPHNDLRCDQRRPT